MPSLKVSLQPNRAGPACRAGLLGMVLAAPALAVECPPMPPAEIAFATPVATPSVHNTRSRAEITALTGAAGMVNTGLTRTQTRLELGVESRHQPLAGNQWCIGIARIEARWIMEPVIIDVAREYRPGSCEYQVVLAHEYEHVAINTRAFKAHVPRLRHRLDEAVRAMGVRPASSEASREAEALTNQLMAAVKPDLAAFETESRSLNARIDTPENYRMLSSRCKKW